MSRRFTHADMDNLRGTRDMLRRLLEVINEIKAETNDLRELIAICGIADELQEKFDYYGRALSRLETTAPPRLPAELRA